jgi:hypothetical protein
MEKCLDGKRFHYLEGDTDSLYFAISGDKNEGINQGFKQIITDDQFYNEMLINGFQVISIHQIILILVLKLLLRRWVLIRNY